MKWRVSTHVDNDDVVIRNKDGDIIANCSVDTPRDYGVSLEDNRKMDRKDATLMASAPELLWVCKALAERLNEADGCVSPMFLEKAIAKAEGR